MKKKFGKIVCQIWGMIRIKSFIVQAPGVDAIKIRKLRIRKKLLRFISKLKIYSFLKRSSFLRIRSLRIFIASTPGEKYVQITMQGLMFDI